MRIRSSLTRYNGHPSSLVTSRRKADRSYRDHLSNPFSSSRAFSRRLAQGRAILISRAKPWVAPDEPASNLGIQRKLHLAGWPEKGEPVDVRLERATVSFFHFDSLPSGSRSRRLIRGFVRGIETKNKKERKGAVRTCSKRAYE